MFLKSLVNFISSKLNSECLQVIDVGEGVFIHYTENNEIIFENSIKNVQFMIKDSYGKLVNTSCSDIDFNRVAQLENSQNANRFLAEFGFGVDKFTNGIALVWWTLSPDGRYFEDEDGFGGEDCDETTIYAFIDTLGSIIIPFRDMTREEKILFRIEAEQKICKKLNINNINHKYPDKK